jgi:hypothetical protein
LPAYFQKSESIPYKKLRLFFEHYLLKNYFENRQAKLNNELLTYIFGAGFLIPNKPQTIELKKSKVLEIAGWNEPEQIAGFYLGKLFSIYSNKELNKLKTRSYKKLAKKIQLAEINAHPRIFSYIVNIVLRQLPYKGETLATKKKKDKKEGKNKSWRYANIPYLSHLVFYFKTMLEADLLRKEVDKYQIAMTFMTGYQSTRSE